METEEEAIESIKRRYELERKCNELFTEIATEHPVLDAGLSLLLGAMCVLLGLMGIATAQAIFCVL